ncbi:putative prophage CPS-53 integrase [compost metagenome]
MPKSSSGKDFTAKWLQYLKPPAEGREEYYDATVHGLGLRVSATGTKVWFVFYRVKGNPKLKRLTMERYPQMSLAAAREKAHEVLFKASCGEDPAEDKQENRRMPTFKAFAEEYIELYAKKHKRSWRKDELAIKKDLLPEWEYRKINDIKRRDVVLILDRISQRGSEIQANRVLALVQKIFNWGIGRGVLEANPCAQMKKPAPENRRDKVLTPEEVRALWQAFSKLDPVIGAAFKMRLVTAQRGKEVDTMRWADVDLKNGWWTIPAEVVKNKASHRVPLTQMALDILEGLQSLTGDSEWVFRAVRGGYLKNPQHTAKEVRDELGFYFVLHDLRRTAATNMASMGISKEVVSRILNHSEHSVTDIYVRHSYDREKRDALEMWDEKLYYMTLRRRKKKKAV